MTQSLRLLILEDNASDAELNLDELRAAGFDPQWQRVETEADYIAALDKKPELILADFSLPQFDGQSALKLLRERGLDTPFILVSGAIGEERAVELLKSGATDYILKDNLGRLAPAVRRALGEADERTRRQQAETAVRQSETQLRQLNAELQASNDSLANSRLAAVNVMQDAIDARREVERVNAELKIANEELAVFNEAAVGRELRMIELKEEINALCVAAGQPPKYDVDFDKEQEQAS